MLAGATVRLKSALIEFTKDSIEKEQVESRSGMVGAEQRFYIRRRQTRRVNQADTSQKQLKETRQTSINSPVDSLVFWRGKSPLQTEAIPTSPDRV